MFSSQRWLGLALGVVLLARVGATAQSPRLVRGGHTPVFPRVFSYLQRS
jgi:hypothetical protein